MRTLSLLFLTACGADKGGDGTDDTGTVASIVDADGDGVAAEDDCDDLDPDTFPGAAERCDGVDNDCDDEVDEDVIGVWYADADEDGHGDPDSAWEVCDPPPGWVQTADDCDDTDATASPEGTEVCDEVDNDCDGDVDEDVTTTYFLDADGDDHGADQGTTEACSLPVGYAEAGGDCDDDDRAVHPAASEQCDGIDNDCDGDVDEDDAVDASTWVLDQDGDGYGGDGGETVACAQPSGYAAEAGDCDDDDADVHPEAAEVCDEVDNDCDGDIDDDDVDATGGATWNIDYDGDGYGSSAYTLQACEAPSGWVADDTDCDDTDATTHPGAAEVCDGQDNDCDGDTDDADGGVTGTSTWYTDADGDGYGDDGASTTAACEAPSGTAAVGGDCDDADATVSPGAVEFCDGQDNDCDGDVDDDDSSVSGTRTWYTDADGDGYGDAGATVQACEAPSGAVSDDTDCDDTDAEVNPATIWYRDDDGDGHGDSTVAQGGCAQPSGHVLPPDDCDDADPAVSPSATEVCGDGVDNDCDGLPGACALSGSIGTSDAMASLIGSTPSGSTGAGVAWAGDSDGDGLDELLVGAPNDASGQAWLLGGPLSGSLDTSFAQASFTGDASGDRMGNALDAGDVDGDGSPDYLIAAPFTGSSAGTTYLYFGPVSGAYAGADADVQITGSASQRSGTWIDVSDYDDDGLDDVLLVSPYGSAGVFLFHAPLSGSLALSSADASFSIGSSDIPSSHAGSGDTNGDGVTDMVIGVHGADSGSRDAGLVAVHLGPHSGSQSFRSADGLYSGAGLEAYAGVEAVLTDINGDGFDDLISGQVNNTGRGWVVLGPTTASTSFDSAAHATISGARTYNVSSGADADGDGNTDILFSDYPSGTSYLFFGPVTGSLTYGSADATITGNSADYLGETTDWSGDGDGDGVPDIAMGAPYDATGGSGAGAVYVFRGAGF